MLNALEPVWDLPQSGVTGMWRTWWLPLLMEAQIATEQFQKAEHSWEQLRSLAVEIPCLRVAAASLGGQLAHHQHDDKTARARYQEGNALPVGENDVPLYRAQLEHAYGCFLLKHREHATALQFLDRSRRRYESVGALPLAGLVTNDLAAAVGGAQNPPAETTAGGLTALTDREHTVVDLAIQGLTNQEIATRLYLSSKTVEYHLSHVYSKLGVTSRRKLRSLAKQGWNQPTGTEPS